ncbi:MAG: adenine deaminase [Actinobacteria bacterium]|nr:adenine deaminase [Actinomycetota bacterium]
MDIKEKITFALGENEVDLLLVNCRLVDVLSGTVHSGSLAVSNGIVVGIDGDYRAKEVVDIEGGFVAPGLYDAHVHLESSMVSVAEFAGTVIPRGTIGVFTDTHEISNVMGTSGIEYIMESASKVMLDVYVMLPPCVPATGLESSGGVLEAGDLRPFVGKPGVLGLGELMNFPGTVAGDGSILEKIGLFPGGPIDGHAPGLSGKELSAYIIAGPDSDHECTTAEEAREKLQKGMYIFLREGTGARNLLDLLPVAVESGGWNCCLCTDDRNPRDLLERGHMDSMLAMAVEAGVEPLTAVRMATINTARRFGLKRRGALAPGFAADIVVFEDLDAFNVLKVFKDGMLVAENGEMKVPPGDSPVISSTFSVGDFSIERLKVPAAGNTVRVIEVVPGQIVTGSARLEAKLLDGVAVQDPERDILKIAVVERHHGTGNIGLGFVRGFGFKSGALASSVAHDSHNIVVVGCSDSDMAAAVAKVIEMGGGQVAVENGVVKSSLSLSIAGLMSELPIEEVALGVDRLNSSAVGMGCGLSDPFMTMSFMALPVIPELKLTDKGLVDVGRFEIVDLFC